MAQLVAAGLAALFGAALAAAQLPAASAAVTVTGCLQRAPDSVASRGKFMLMNAGPSPMGADAPRDIAPPEPARTNAPVEHRPGESDVREGTGGVMYLLEGDGRDFESKVGQRLEVTGTMGREVAAPPSRPSTARPMLQLHVTRARAVAPHC